MMRDQEATQDEMGLRGFEWVEERGSECENPRWERVPVGLS